MENVELWAGKMVQLTAWLAGESCILWFVLQLRGFRKRYALSGKRICFIYRWSGLIIYNVYRIMNVVSLVY